MSPSRWERLTTAVFAVIAVAAVLFVAFAALSLLSQACACVPPPPSSESPIDGVVVKIDSAGIGNVRGFTMRLAGGATIDLVLGTLENPAAFAPGHLAEHQATASPVRAYFVLKDGVPVVYRLEDAPVGASSSP